jgi:hypothetical protein
MNCGANVPTGVLLRVEFDRNRVESFLPSNPLLRVGRDSLRRWPILDSGSASGDEIRPNVGRVVPVGDNDGDGLFLGKGLFRELRA